MASTDPQTRPFDLNPKDLRTLLSGRKSFSTSYAMRILRLREPDATVKLIEMTRSGWIEYDGESKRIDWWKAARLGINFSMKKMLKRVTVAQGMKIVENAVAAARAFNDEDRATAITRISLFGSLVRGGDESGTIGDVDLQVVYENRRSLCDDELNRRIAADKVGAPRGWTYLHEPEEWGRRRGLRAIRAVSTRISASTWDNIGGMGCEHRVVYAYDSTTGREIPFDPATVPADASKQQAFNVVAVVGPLPPVPVARAMPAFPRHATGHARVDAESAEYGWTRGMSIAAIGKWLGKHPDEVKAVLAARGMDLPDPRDVVLCPSPLETLDRFMSAYPGHHFEVRMMRGSQGGMTLVSTRHGGRRGHAAATASGVERSDDAMLSALCAVVAEAGEAWYARIRRNFPHISLGLSFDFNPGQDRSYTAAPAASGANALATAFNARFDELYATTPASDLVRRRQLKSGHLLMDLLPQQRLEYMRRDEWRRGTPVDDPDLLALARPLVETITAGRDLSFTGITLERHESDWIDE